MAATTTSRDVPVHSASAHDARVGEPTPSTAHRITVSTADRGMMGRNAAKAPPSESGGATALSVVIWARARAPEAIRPPLRPNTPISAWLTTVRAAKTPAATTTAPRGWAGTAPARARTPATAPPARTDTTRGLDRLAHASWAGEDGESMLRELRAPDPTTPTRAPTHAMSATTVGAHSACASAACPEASTPTGAPMARALSSAWSWV